MNTDTSELTLKVNGLHSPDKKQKKYSHEKETNKKTKIQLYAVYKRHT